QLALVTPGISPRMAMSRSLPRARPNLLYTPRGRPVSAQRLRSRTGLLLRGSFCSLSRAAVRSSSEALLLLMMAFSSARLAANFFTAWRRFCSRLTSAGFAMTTSVLEGEPEGRQERARFLVGLRCRGDGDVHAPQSIDLVVLDLREDDLFLDAQVEI